MTEAEQNRLIIDNAGLVRVIAADFRGGILEFDDLVSSGHEGLTKAARQFDPAKGQFSIWAASKIRIEIFNAVEAAKRQAGPIDGVSPPFGGDSIEKIYEHSAWGEIGNAMAISEAWTVLDASPEDLAIMHDEIKSRQDRFGAAFMSLTGAQRKLVNWVFIHKPRMPLTDAARELGVSCFQATRMLKRALKTMREVILRMESNQRSGGKNANGRPHTPQPSRLRPRKPLEACA